MTALTPVKLFGLVILIVLGSFFVAQASTRLALLPLKQHVAIRLGSQGTLLVQEKRILTLKKGVNKIKFSWQNVRIDPSGITLAPLLHPDKITLLSVSFPPGETALVWDVFCLEDLEQEMMISYLPADIDAIVAYKAVADPLEKTLDLKTFLVLRNFSGLDFDPATVYTGFKDAFVTHIQHLETKQILVSHDLKIPIKKIFTWDASFMPHAPENSAAAAGTPIGYEIINHKASNLGNAALWQGKARLFQQDSQGGTLFLGEDLAGYTPVGDKIQFHLGDSRDLVVTQHRLDSQKTAVKRNANGHIQVYDEIITDQVIMENLKDSPVVLSLIQTIQGQWEPLDISMAYQLKDYKTLAFTVELLAKDKKTLTLRYRILNIFAKHFSQYNQ